MKQIIPKTELAYLAGYIDGDGCFYIGYERRKRRLKPKAVASIVITSVHEKTLKTFKRVFGGSVCMVMRAYDNKRALYHYSARKCDSITICRHILPYLVEKVDECQLMLDFISSPKQEHLINMKTLKDISNPVSKYHKEEFERLKYSVAPTETDFAYLAGFIDAECCLGISRYKPKNRPNYTYKILLQLNNTKSPVFRWLLERFGGHIHFINRIRHAKARKNQLCWRLSGRALSKILPNIHPYLRTKKPVCEELIKFYNTTLPNGGARHTEAFRSRYDRVIKERENIVNKVHKLNLKGINNT